MKVCVAFFGITRSLSHTKDSILENMLSPLSAFFDLEIVAHFYENAFDETAEGGLLENEILPFDDIKIQAAEDPEKLDEFQKIKEFGDYWNNDFKSTRNLFLQLGSLQAVHSFPQVRDSDICLFLRPDLLMHTSFSKSIVSIRNLRDDRILLPFWQNWKGGLNDRFAFCKGERAKKAYACRGRHALEFCQRTGGALQSEQLLRYSVMRYGVKTQDLSATASRVRADGRIVKEDFARRSFRTWRQRRRLTKDWDFSDLDDQ